MLAEGLALPGLVLADPGPRYSLQCEDPADRATCVQPLLKGELAPFDGQLLTNEAAIELGLAIERSDRLLKLELDRVTETASIALETERKLHKIELRVKDKEIDHWQQRALTAENPPFYVHPVFVAGVAVAGTLLLTVVVGYAIRGRSD